MRKLDIWVLKQRAIMIDYTFSTYWNICECFWMFAQVGYFECRANKYQQYIINKNKMFGKYHDGRVYQHFVHTYSKVPYLDTEIFNVETNALRESRRANLRAQAAAEGLKRTEEKSEQLSNSIRDCRIKKEQEAKEFLLQLQKTQQECLHKQKLAWSDYERTREESQLSNIRDQKYLQSILKTNSTKAESRLTSVRRWH